MTTKPKPSPDELDKAIEHWESRLKECENLDTETAIITGKDLKVFVLAAKQSRELREQRDAIWGDLGIRTKERDALQQQSIELREQLDRTQLNLVNRNSWARDVQQSAKNLEQQSRADKELIERLVELLIKSLPDQEAKNLCSCHICTAIKLARSLGYGKGE